MLSEWDNHVQYLSMPLHINVIFHEKEIKYLSPLQNSWISNSSPFVTNDNLPYPFYKQFHKFLSSHPSKQCHSFLCCFHTCAH
jgi:hypothetical protein